MNRINHFRIPLAIIHYRCNKRDKRDDSVNLLPLLEDTSWDLYECDPFINTTKYTELNLPKTIYELFLGKK